MCAKKSNNEYLDEEERREAKKRSEESMNCMYVQQQAGLNCDAIIHTDDGGHFPVHTPIMSRCSPYFHALFRKSVNDQPKKEVNIPGIEASIMRLIVQYAYTREVPITEQNASDLMVEADQLAILTLVDQCGQFMAKHIEDDNCVEVYNFARNYFFQKLADAAYKYLLKNFANVQVVQLEKEQLMILLKDDQLNVANEYIVWEAVLKWIDCDPENRAADIAELFKCVRFGLMDQLSFRQKVKNNRYVKSREEECRPVVIQTMMYLAGLQTSTPKENIVEELCRPRYPQQLLFAVGGWSGGNPTAIIETYDNRLDQWLDVYVDGSHGPRAYHGCIVLESDLYVIGGFDGVDYFNGCWCLNLPSQCWREISPMHAQRCYVSVALLDDLIYAMGGYNGQHRQNSAEVYDPKLNQWKNIAPMHILRSDADATAYNGKIFIVGGFNGQTCLNSAEYYDPATNQWTLLPFMTTLRSGVSCIAYHGCIYAVGGFNGTTRLRSVEKFDVVRGVWSSAPDMNNYRSNFGVEVMDDRLYVIGGYNGITTTNDVEYYDERSNSWHRCKNMNIVRSALAVCVVSGIENMHGYLDMDRGLTSSTLINRRLSSTTSRSSDDSSTGSELDRSLSD